MGKLKQALYVCNDTDEIDITPEALDEMEAKGATLILDWPTFAREYNPHEIYGVEGDKRDYADWDDKEEASRA